MLDLKDQLKNLFPNHVPTNEESSEVSSDKKHELYVPEEPLICKYEKRKGKPVTIIEAYSGELEDFKILAKEIKVLLGVGGSFKDEKIIIQGDYRQKIMDFLKEKGFKVKRVGG